MSRKIAEKFIDSIDAGELDCSVDYNEKLKKDLTALINKARIEELEMLTRKPDLDVGTYRLIENRMSELKSKQKGANK